MNSVWAYHIWIQSKKTCRGKLVGLKFAVVRVFQKGKYHWTMHTVRTSIVEEHENFEEDELAIGFDIL